MRQPWFFVSAVAMSTLATIAHAQLPALPDPIPVLTGGRILLPGPQRLGLDGPSVEPSTIGNFRGLVALAYLRGKIRDAAGERAVMANDVRLFQGDYVAADGVERRGTFAFL